LPQLLLSAHQFLHLQAYDPSSLSGESSKILSASNKNLDVLSSQIWGILCVSSILPGQKIRVGCV
jgi:hypothetical protein